MALEIDEQTEGKILIVRVSDKLEKEDYEQFLPKIEQLIKQHGKIRILFEMEDFSGWEAGALWEDIKFDAKHFNDIERIAMVGEKIWQKGMSKFCKPFTTAEIRYFDKGQSDEALIWLKEDL